MDWNRILLIGSVIALLVVMAYASSVLMGHGCLDKQFWERGRRDGAG